MSQINKQVMLAARPTGFPKETDFQLVETPVPEPNVGELLVRTHFLSVDPYMRGRMTQAKSYAPPVEIGEVMPGGVVGVVVESKSPKFHAGDHVEGMLGWQEYAVTDEKELRKVDPTLAPVSTALGLLGMPGLTAYFGLLDVCAANAGETVVVNAAAGAVGSVVGQIAKIIGCRAVGIAGSEKKVRYVLDDLGFDGAFNYKTVTGYRAKLKELCPQGIDCYFDNVGGAITDAAVPLLNVKGRVAVCGQISQYNLEKPELGPRLFRYLIAKRARVEGFLVFDYAERYTEALERLSAWYREGRLKFAETIAEGLENAPAAFIGMLHGQNLGKQLVKVSQR